MLEARFGEIGNERYKQYLKDIHTSGGFLLSLVNDLLNLSKIEAGKFDLSFAPVSLNELALQTIALLQPQANARGLILRSNLQPVPQVVADMRSIRQILLNLLSNAIRFTPGGGQVIVSTVLNEDGGLSLRVRDTGVGMTEFEISLAVEPFRQIKTEHDAGHNGGAGLGLPISKALAEANHARFDIVSEPKKGTLISVTFPEDRLLTERF
jgi:signal transduction histidine kinase